jgi:branched-chain amino acid transport system substrate-binding protein
MYRHARALVGLALVPLVAVSACSSSGASSGAGPSAGAGFSLSKPVALGFLWEVKGESAYALDDYQQGAMLAVDEINQAGGVGGQQISTKRFPGSPVDSQALVSNYLKLAETGPDVMIGVPGLNVEALKRSVDKAGIPLLSQAPDTLTVTGGANASQWLFTVGPTPTNQATAASDYVVQELGAKKVALLHTNEPFGQEGFDVQSKALPALGVQVVVKEGFAADATDLTQQVLAVKKASADAAIAWAYPNPTAVMLNQFVQNNIDIPTVGNQGVEVDTTYGLVEGATRKKLYSIGECNVINPEQPAEQKFFDAYKARWKTNPSTFAALAYDSVHLAVNAITTAKSTDHDKVREALSTLRYTTGVCSSDYHSVGNVMSRQLVTLFYGGPTVKTMKTYQFTGNDGK